MTEVLGKYVDSLPAQGAFSIWAGPVSGRVQVAVADHTTHYAASTMKIWVVLAAYRLADRGTLDLDSTVRIRAEFPSARHDGSTFSMDRAEDSDDETWQRMDQHVALRWLARRAIVRSGNLAANLVLDAVGFPAVADALAVTGVTDSVIERGIEDYPATSMGIQNTVSAHDLAVAMQELYAERAAAPDSCRELLAILAAQQVNNAIPGGLPPGTKVAHKSGWVDGVSHDAGIIYPGDAPPYVLAVCTTSDLPATEALQVITGAAAASWEDRHQFAGPELS